MVGRGFSIALPVVNVYRLQPEYFRFTHSNIGRVTPSAFIYPDDVNFDLADQQRNGVSVNGVSKNSKQETLLLLRIKSLFLSTMFVV